MADRMIVATTVYETTNDGAGDIGFYQLDDAELAQVIAAMDPQLGWVDPMKLSFAPDDKLIPHADVQFPVVIDWVGTFYFE